MSRPLSPAIHDLNGACGSKDPLVDRYIGTLTVDSERYCRRGVQHTVTDTVSGRPDKTNDIACCCSIF